MFEGKEIFSVISTNLSLKLSDAQVDDLLQCGLGIISVSLDGVTPETYGKYRVGGNFDLVVENLHRLIRRKKELGLEFPMIQWRFLVFDHNFGEIDQVQLLAREWGVDLLDLYSGVTPPDPAPGAVRHHQGRLPDNTFQSEVTEWMKRRQDTTLRTYLRNHPNCEIPPVGAYAVPNKCDWLYFSTMLYPDGPVGPCCVVGDDTFDFGKLDKGGDFSRLWNGEAYKAARTALLHAEEPSDLICTRCPCPPSKHYQFVPTFQGILFNAPDWVLKLLVSCPETFFFDLDRVLLMNPIGLLFSPRFAEEVGRFSPEEAEIHLAQGRQYLNRREDQAGADWAHGLEGIFKPARPKKRGIFS